MNSRNWMSQDLKCEKYYRLYHRNDFEKGNKF